ncbi:hypothetical protein [uncultured Ruminococcus sp.]|uniref:hypothetical protein n=1 Tax=uncultured Ruminococcus sp. TaxID=165186 RepID=UPI0029309043|nr:hypothetical protein [uncultured Ruminococcus sp.]
MKEKGIAVSDGDKSNDLVLYPPPYKIINSCLYKEITGKSGITTKKLCNFLPYIVSEVSVDDGAEVKTMLRLGGVHSSGKVLQEIDVTGAELGTFNWLIERWGADCVLEPERSVKEYVRHAIQQTAANAERIQTYHVTGWKLINNNWEYLLPNDGKHDVSLRGKLSRYEKADSWTVSGLSSAYFMTSYFPFAPDEITLPLLAFTFLTPLNDDRGIVPFVFRKVQQFGFAAFVPRHGEQYYVQRFFIEGRADLY